MKVFFDTNIILDAAIRAEKYPESLILLNNLMDAPGFSLWASAISINNTEYIVSKIRNKEKAEDILNLLKENFSIIPFRKSGFVKALKVGGPDFEDTIQMVGAEEMGLDYIVTRNKDHFAESRVPAVTPIEFLEEWNAGKFDRVCHVPFLDLKAQHHQIYNEVDDRITNIIANTAFIMGKEVEGFEERFAEAQGAKYCIGVSSGTDALHLALWALGLGSEDRVVVPVNTFMATAEAVSLTGADPVFVDCDEYFNIDVDKIREILESKEYGAGSRERSAGIEEKGERIEDKEDEVSRETKETKQTRQIGRIAAIIPVHLYGQPANMAEILPLAEEYKLKVVEDACQAHLARWQVADGRWLMVGIAGDAGAFSFFPGKNLGAYGEAGAMITNDDELYEKMKLIHNHGSKIRYYHDVVGHNYRMEAIQGAVLNVKLKYLEQWTKARQCHATLYEELLKDIEEVVTPKTKPGRTHSFHLYVIRCRNRDRLQNYLKEKGIDTGLHYPVPLHLQKAFTYLGHRKGDFPLAEKYAEEILSLPMFPELTEREIRYVAEHIKGFYVQRI